MERQRIPNHLKGPLHITRCFGELALLSLMNTARNGGDAIDAAWPEDDDLDQAIPSTFGKHQEQPAA